MSAEVGQLWVMEAIVVVMGIGRICLVAGVAALNVDAIFRPRGVSLGSLTTEATLLCNVVYLTSWLPFLLYSLCNGRWVILEDVSYCHLQNFVTNAIAMIFLGLLSVLALDKVRTSVFRRSPVTSRSAGIAVFLVWVIPQFLYDVAALMGGHRYCRPPVFKFLDDILLPTKREFNISNVITSKYRIGFMICEEVLTTVMVAEHLWQYVLIVIPFSTLVVGCGTILLGRQLTKHCGRNRMSIQSGDVDTEVLVKRKEQDNSVRSLLFENITVLNCVLVLNFLWHLLMRPFIIYYVWTSAAPNQYPMFMDFGSHLVLTISTVFIPLAQNIEPPKAQLQVPTHDDYCDNPSDENVKKLELL